ncbi:alpha galactosidase A [Mucilaginibacter gracilis]|uniref:Alpha-galactosidase n=1 Tax=Mucilaginibacter gracilis TaxID=423350 RepID=A0A495JAG2_9SPHI|nr:glycoside hydrolase family 27 protein [Mucilaginibacter gracilis]RKR85701.1 alpha galactosidase A [Mucilaginibacter gracilis]
MQIKKYHRKGGSGSSALFASAKNRFHFFSIGGIYNVGKAMLLSLQLTLFLLMLLFGAASAQTKNFHTWAQTPPMGWNSWDCFGPTVVEDEVKANADYMAKNLKSVGWEYIIVDIRWYVGNDKAHGYNETDPDYVLDEYGRFQPAVNRFPSAAGGKGFKPLADYIHSKGLKFGIHIMRGVPVEAVKRNLPILGSKATAKDIYSLDGQCKWLHDMYTVVAGRDGAQEYYYSLFKLYASWGLDFVKVDDLSRPYHAGEVEMIRKAIDLTGRKIVLSTSPGETPLASAVDVQNHANMWRTVDDFWDNWNMLKDHFSVFERWNPYRIPGGWPDGDMLPLGKIGIRAERGNPRMTAFTHDEQYTLMTLWTIFRSPMMFGGNLPDNDEFTLSLLSNKEVMHVLNYSTNNKELFRTDNGIAWIADDPKTGAKYLAVFNPADGADAVKVNVKLADLGFKKTCKIKDLWNKRDLGQFTGQFAPAINKHGAGLYRITEK